MNPTQKILLLIGSCGLLGLAGVVMIEAEPALAEQENGADPETPESKDKTPADLKVTTSAKDPDPGKTLADPPTREVPEFKDGFGMISGRIGLNTRVLPKLDHFQIVIREAVNTNRNPNLITKKKPKKPFQKVVWFRKKNFRGTPFFDITDIPISRHPYRVTVVAAGLNGSTDTVQVTEAKREGHKEARLHISPGTIFSVRLIDQRKVAREGLMIRMVPTDGGPMLPPGESSRSGTHVFENVVAGDYTIYVGPMNAPFAEPKDVQVYSGGIAHRNGRPQAQGMTIEVPDGLAVTVNVKTKWGSPVDGASLRLYQIDVKRLREVKGVTDQQGQYVFPSIQYGEYQLDVSTKEHNRRGKRFKVTKGETPPMIKVTM